MARRSLFVDTTPLRESPAFARLWAGGALTGIGNQMTIVVVGLEIYALTSSTLSVAMVGVFAVVPMVVFGLYGGMLADAFDRRKVALVAAIGAWLSTAIIALHAWWGMESVGLLYLLTAVNSVASTLMSSTRFAIIPRLVPPAHLPAAAALSGISTGIMVTVGPALAGVLVALVGFPITYTIDVVLFLGAFLGIVTLPAIKPEGEVHPPGLQSLKSGWRFLKSAPNIRMQFLLDIIAMTFGQPRVLFPAVGALVLGGGAVTVGVLTAAGAVGALGSSVLSGRLGGVRWQGKAIGRAIQGYGACMAGFGLVLLASALGLFGPVPTDGTASVVAILAAALMLALAGACDEISAIFRSTMMQSAVPDAMRGRLQGLFIVVVTGGPRLGDLYVGLLASITMLWFPPLLGGVLIVLVVTVLVRVQGTLRLYDAKNPVP